MMNRIPILLVCIPLLLQPVAAQEKEEGPVQVIRLSGFVKTDIFYDSRQSSAANGIREGHFYLYPDDILYDEGMNDLNANPSFHILNIQTRVRADINGPDAFGAKIAGAVEAEFFGTGESDLNGLRLRHAYVRMEWPKAVLLTGQYWHPMFPAENFPGTVSFNTGAPFVPFSRNPQVRLTLKPGKVNLVLAAYTQRDFTSSGPDGNSSKYIRNSGLPGVHLQLKLPAGEHLTAWTGIDYKVIRPELKSPANYETDATVSGLAAFATVKVKTRPVNISLMGVYSENGSDMVMLGGYGVSGITNELMQTREWTTINSTSFWADITTNGKKAVFGIFSGYSKNLGAKDQITGAVFGRGTDIDHLFRVSPRIVVTEGKLSLAAELESTMAAYGTRQDDGTVTETHTVNNIRVLLSAIYRF
ncbi:MAG: hypothetical protein MUE37_04215 [Bacteroidales bacterium]|jgi:hypothetical protein|nr:hypothetical protein [Bacteroidales bacterium]